MTEKRVTYRWQPGAQPQPEEKALKDMGPKELLLAAMGLCTVMTAVALFGKMHLSASELRVETSGMVDGKPERGDSLFASFTQIFRVACPETEREQVTYAIELTQQKYCGVGTMLARVAPVKYELYINDK